MSIWKEIGSILNSTVRTGLFMPLDKLLGARLFCAGAIGTKFTISNVDSMFLPIVITITKESYLLPSGSYLELVSVPCGVYTVKMELHGAVSEVTVNASTVGQTYKFDGFAVLEKFTSNGTFVVPSGVNKIFLTAIGGGAGGGKGYSGGSSSGAFGGPGGGGGGSGDLVRRKVVNVTPGQSVNITVGVGGEPGQDGSATVIEGILTLAGGHAGSQGTVGYGDAGTPGIGGEPGGTGGNSGSDGTVSAGGNYLGGNGGKGGDGLAPGGEETPGTYKTDTYANAGNDGNLGSGGSGGGGCGNYQVSHALGGRGGDGIVIIEIEVAA